jgi:hypothetical protein
MFHLHILKGEKIIQNRECFTAHTCTEKMLAAHDYYHHKGEAVTIQMLDDRLMLIKELNSVESAADQIDIHDT